jgi:hypothetical protein
MTNEVGEGELEKVVQGSADEGERIVVIVKQKEREDEEMVLVNMEGDDSDEEEGDGVPTVWT